MTVFIFQTLHITEKEMSLVTPDPDNILLLDGSVTYKDLEGLKASIHKHQRVLYSQGYVFLEVVDRGAIYVKREHVDVPFVQQDGFSLHWLDNENVVATRYDAPIRSVKDLI